MERKKIILIGLACALAVLLLTVIFLTGPARQSAAVPGAIETAPPAQTRPLPAPPVQTTVPETTVPETTAPETTAPETTVPEETTEPTEAPEPTEPQYTEPEETLPPVYETVLFPVTIEDGMLTVHSVFTFTGMNPDVENLFGEEIAGIQMTNTSDEHMTFAEITAVLADGTTLTFRAQDVPPGMSVMAFALEHEPLEDPAQCEEVFGYAEFENGDLLRSDLVQLQVTGTEITVKNVSGTDLTNLDVICHGLLDGGCFGGRTYSYRISSLRAGATTVVHAVDCILGMTQVVRVEIDS